MIIDFEITPRDVPPGSERVLRAGDSVDIDFTIRDEGSGNPISSLNPAAWLARTRTKGAEPRAACGDLVRSALGQSFLSRPELDLNAYYVLAMNADATITVVDPLFGFGGTKLLAIVPLQSAGEDWAQTKDQNRLLVTMPGANRVAVVDTRTWSVTSNIDIGGAPSRVMLQPDEAYAWVAYASADAASAGTSSADASSQSGGVAVLDVRTLKVVARIATGRGPHQIAFTDDSRWAFVANGHAGTVSLVDVRSLDKVKDITIGAQVSSIAFSTRARAAYVTSGDTGTVTAIDPTKRDIIARMPAAPGIGAIAFAPDGRLGFVTNSSTHTVSIFDAALNRIVRTAEVEKAPDQLAFSSRFAYVHHRDSEIVAMVPLDELRNAGSDAAGAAGVPLLDFPGGQHAPSQGSRAGLASSIVRSADDNAVLVANPRDKAIYYYQEGMAAPMGQFNNYGREPIAVLVVDRGLREDRPGRYRSTALLPAAGQYNALLLINSPRVVHCFELSIEVPVRKPTDVETITTNVEPVTRDTTVVPGTPIKIALRFTDGRTGAPVANAHDAGILIVVPGVWQARPRLAHEGNGVYTATIAPPSSGLYTVFINCPSRKLEYRRVFTFEAVEGSK